ncbi:MAG: Minf_1886 family protein, partial [candidate division WOR-3 bacterium]
NMILLNELLKKDPRFTIDAYLLINEGLRYVHQVIGKKSHVSAQELLEAIRRLMSKRYGPMAKAVLNSWGIFSTDDIGEVVLNLVNAGLMLKEEADPIENFHAVYDFDTAFVEEYDISEENNI